MEWEKKLQQLQQICNEEYALIIHSSFRDKPASSEFIKELEVKYPSICEPYVGFLLKFNGVHLSDITLCGDGSSVIPFGRLGVDHLQLINKEKYFVFGKDYGARYFSLDTQGRVCCIEFEDFSPKTIVIKKCFDEFLNNVVLGPGYFDFFKPDEGDEWYQYLKSLGWTDR